MHHNTCKALVCIAASGAVILVSSLFSGCISDVHLTCRSGFLDMLEPGDHIMADRGFTISDEVTARGAQLKMPVFLQSRKQFTPSEVLCSRRIASVRIYVERVIGREDGTCS